ncbi:MAG: serine hydrolase [Patescibacteria group bacterium]|nr:serine hydrolase [Patescibacteria group bacterium]
MSGVEDETNKVYRLSRPKAYLICIGLFVVAFGFAYLFFRLTSHPSPSLSTPSLRLNSTNLKYTNPLILSSSLGDKKQFTEYKPLENEVNQFITQARAEGSLLDLGMYYRDLTDGSWTGVNEDDKFSPGSLQKVPLMIAYLKLSETDPAILNEKLIDNLTSDVNSIQSIKPAHSIQYGQSASVLDLIKLMIGFSDNNATDVLFNNIDHNNLKEVFSDLGVNFNENTTHSDYISTKQFALFFRILYNSTYLDWYNSELSLSLMTQTDFKDGLAAGVPANIPVAHKFGESYDASEAPPGGYPPEQLHDCGIIYYPKHPYILCVMTKGVVPVTKNSDNVSSLEKDIQTVSSMVYADVQNRYH